MRLRFLFAVLLLLLLPLSLSFSEKSYTITETDYNQIITSLMSAQKELTNAQNSIQVQEAELQALRNNLKEASASYEMQLKEASKGKFIIAGCAFYLGASVATIAVVLITR